MANRHHAEIGDVFKHLLLAEILVRERPGFYLESHAGSALYPLKPSLGRDYGAGRTLEQGVANPALSASAYHRMLVVLAGQAGGPAYPGSPWIALSLLPVGTRFLFCDRDKTSLASIRRASTRLGHGDVRTCGEEGLTAVAREIEGLADPSGALVFLDPYDPAEKGGGDEDAFGVFHAAAARGVRAALWAGFDDGAGRDRIRSALPSSADVGEMELVGMDDPSFDVEPGVLGCTLAVAGLGEGTRDAAAGLLEALEEVYADAAFPGGQTGRIRTQWQRA